GTSKTHAASFGQPDHIKDIVLGLRAADDVLPDRLRRINQFELADGPKGIDQLVGLGRNNIAALGRSACRQGRPSISQFGFSYFGFGQFRVPGLNFSQVNLARCHLPQNLEVHAGMLANIENLQMEAEGSELAQQWIDKGLSQALAAIGYQARPQQSEIGFK